MGADLDHVAADMPSHAARYRTLMNDASVVMWAEVKIVQTIRAGVVGIRSRASYGWIDLCGHELGTER